MKIDTCASVHPCMHRHASHQHCQEDSECVVRALSCLSSGLPTKRQPYVPMLKTPAIAKHCEQKRGVQPEGKRPMIFWTSMQNINLWRIDMEHKTWRTGFKASGIGAYFQAQQKTVLDWKYDAANGGPFDLLDVFSIAAACGPSCTHDGLHSSDPLDRATLQVMANMYAEHLRNRRRYRGATAC
jgi:hypothetical protein